MKYISLFSGIESATQAWHPLGFEPLWFSEIDKFPSAVLAHHYPNIPNRGDINEFQAWPDASPDLIVGGSPCQSFSCAGLRQGLADPRGQLMLTYLAVLARYRPRWVLWENVPGVLSSHGGRDFGTLLGALGELGYGWAYRVMDAQYVRTQRFRRAVPQRRRRVFVVGYLGDAPRAAKVLFEREGMFGDPPTRRESGEEVTRDTASCLGASGRGFARVGETRGQDPLVAVPAVSNALTRRDYKGVNSSVDGQPLIPEVAHTLRGEGFDASEEGTGRGTPIIPISFHPTQDPISAVGRTHALSSGSSRVGQASIAVCFQPRVAQGYPAIVQDNWVVRRLTVRECERLMGFPDDYTLIPWRGKEADRCPDGPRYKALGNSMAVNVMHWIGERLQNEQA